MNLNEFLTFCQLRGDVVKVTNCVRTTTNPVIACEYKTVEIRDKAFKSHAFVEYREGFGRTAIEKCTFYHNTTHRGRLKFDDISFEKLVSLYLESK